jgi:penicillin amidase
MRRWLLRGVIPLVVLTLLLFVAAWLALRGSLPSYEGELALPGLSAPVAVERDAQGVVTLDAEDPLDLARALGFVHGQERFFEMDLKRRLSAGELAALLGERALPSDRRNRVHRLRARVTADLPTIAGPHAGLLAAYAEGVNAGLAALAVRPWPYLLLRQQPEPWRPEDSLLAGYALFFDLQDETNSRELALWRIRQHLPPALATLLLRDGTSWDAPLFGEARGDAVLPGPELVDLRQLPQAPVDAPAATLAEPAAPGSNNFAAGRGATADGRAIVAGDMHLTLRAPSLWFRARLRYADPAAPAGRVDVTGVTLPGVPGVIAGSNGHVAWTFTNSYGDWLDFFEVRLAADDPTRYLTPEGESALRVHEETIVVAGGRDETLVVRETRWGPLLPEASEGLPDDRALALRWTAHQPGALDFGLLGLARAGDLDAALAAARETGVPAQNLLVGDRHGRIAWRLIGRIPDRVGGCDPQAPLDPLAGCDWAGWWTPDSALQAEIVDPPSGRLWTANARVVDGALLARVGDSGYALGARQRLIGEAMNAAGPIDEPRLLALQLDDRAVFLERWNRLLRERLARPADEQEAAEFAELAEAAADWSGHASVDSAGYRLTRAFRLEVLGRIRDGLLGPAWAALGEDFVKPDLPQLEGVAWPLVTQRPAHLLPPRFADWDALLLDAAHAAAEAVRGEHRGPLRERRWGEANTARICHPLAAALPGPARRWLCMPADPLPGDAQMARVQGPSFGASQRMVVAPGREAQGFFHLPGGQVGHPLSPYWGAGHADWVAGRPSPFLPGPVQARLRLQPVAPPPPLHPGDGR